jgi:IS66 C-terminal element
LRHGGQIGDASIVSAPKQRNRRDENDVETAKANGCEPYAYLRRAFTDLPKATTLAEIEATVAVERCPDSDA